MNKEKIFKQIDELKEAIEDLLCAQQGRLGVEKYIEKNPVFEDSYAELDGDYVKVPLPSANTKWTFSAWDWVKAFVKRFPKAYPEHSSDFEDDHDYQYIDIESLEGGER